MSETGRQTSLKEICFCAVRKHFACLDVQAVLDLPIHLIKDLLPHLTVCQLDEIQPGLNQRGISTHSGWAGVLHDLFGPNYAVGLHTEDEAKHKVMRILFTLVFYGFTNPFVKKNAANLNTSSFLWAAAKCIKHFLFLTSTKDPLQSFTAEHRPLLNLLEKRIVGITVSHLNDVSNRKTQMALYVLHRLLDHGVAKKLVIHVQCPILLAWLVHGRGSHYVSPELKRLMHSRNKSCTSPVASTSADRASCSADLEAMAPEDQDDQVPSSKRSRFDNLCMQGESRKANFTVDPQILCQNFSPHDGATAGACPWGQIECLEVRQCNWDSLSVLQSALPTFLCLRSLTLHSVYTLKASDVLGLVKALKQLSESSGSSLTDLNIGILPHINVTEILLDASPKVTSLHVEIQSLMWGRHATGPRPDTSELPELVLKKLSVKVVELRTELRFLTSVLRRSPHLTSLHVAGMRLPTGSSLSQLLATLSESNRCLRSLNLEDLNLSDCLPDILSLLRDCKLEELQCNDCRLLEKCSDTEGSLQRLVAALKKVPSLHTLSLAQNRLTKNVCVLAELFTGTSPSSVKRLDISSNFIQPAELLEFSHRLRTHCPPHRLTLDLRKNPGDRDADTWNAALEQLRPFCVLLIEGWNSTDTLVDHISNM